MNPSDRNQSRSHPAAAPRAAVSIARALFRTSSVATLLGVCAVAGGAAPATAFAAADAPVGPDPKRAPVADLRGGPLGVERTASSFGRPVPYVSPRAARGKPVWLRIDMGRAFPIEAVKLYPFWQEVAMNVTSHNFPARFKIEASESPDFPAAATTILADFTAKPFAPEVPLQTATFAPPAPLAARYVRLSVAEPQPFFLWRFEVISGGADVSTGKQLHDSVNGDLNAAWRALPEHARRVAAEANHTDPAVHPLLRPRRPDGESVVTDKPGQVTASDTWRPVAPPVRTPRRAVLLGEGALGAAHERNIGYLLTSFSLDALVYNFLVRDKPAAVPAPKGFRKGDFWTDTLSGSNAARFLMGAGNTLRWPAAATANKKRAELRQRLDTIVAVIASQTRPDGYSYAFPEQRILSPDQDAYTRSWHIQGLIEAGHAGNPTAWELVRKQGDWFNTCPYLPELFRRIKLGNQGSIANTRTYIDTPLGVPGDIQVIQRHFQPDWWLAQLTARDPAAIWQYPYERTHSYLIASLWSFMDMYEATGAPLYINAMRGAWDIVHDHFLHTGGSISICEAFTYPFQQYPAGSRYLRANTGEMCGNAFWINFNQKFRNLEPGDGAEKYVSQIEKSLYNVILANQNSSGNIRYHARLLGEKENGQRSNTCCEGQGARVLGALPEYIYSLETNGKHTKPATRENEEAKGVYIDLFHNSAIAWKTNGKTYLLRQETEFPIEQNVKITLSVAKDSEKERFRRFGDDAPVGNSTDNLAAAANRNPAAAAATAAAVAPRVHIRIPGWASAPVDIHHNGKKIATGKPGSYVTVESGWKCAADPAAADEITFTLPLEFRLTKYNGVEPEFAGKPAYALEYGPFLMAAIAGNNPASAPRSAAPAISRSGVLTIPFPASDLPRRLRPIPDRPLHFLIEGTPGVIYTPYYRINQQRFTTYPFFTK